MTNTNELTAKLKAAAKEEIMCREACDTSDLWQDDASPENILALTEALEAAENRVAELVGERTTILNDLCIAFVKHANNAGLDDDENISLRECTDALQHCRDKLLETYAAAGIKLQIEGE